MPFRKNQFPLGDENKRVKDPQVNRKEWRADSESLLAENPLLLNPEIDEPSQSLAFHPDGRIYGLDNRGTVTINTFGLNRAPLVEERKKVIYHFRTAFNEVLYKLKKTKGDQNISDLLDLAFEYPFNELITRTEPKAEFSLLGRHIFKNFNSIFVNNLKDTGELALLRQSFEYFSSKR
ncbi:MAG: hypothetical protein GY757_42915 [bacterium]|nr:hypothetical protein [bacterium]